MSWSVSCLSAWAPFDAVGRQGEVGAIYIFAYLQALLTHADLNICKSSTSDLDLCLRDVLSVLVIQFFSSLESFCLVTNRPLQLLQNNRDGLAFIGIGFLEESLAMVGVNIVEPQGSKDAQATGLMEINGLVEFVQVCGGFAPLKAAELAVSVSRCAWSTEF